MTGPLRDTETIRAALTRVEQRVERRHANEAAERGLAHVNGWLAGVSFAEWFALVADRDRLVGRLQAAEQELADEKVESLAAILQRDEARAQIQAAEQEREGRVLVGQVEWDAIERRLERMVALETALREIADRHPDAQPGDHPAVDIARAALSVSPAPSEEREWKPGDAWPREWKPGDAWPLPAVSPAPQEQQQR